MNLTTTHKRTPPAWHAEATDLIRTHFGEITRSLLDATRRAVWLGLLFQHVKTRGKQDGTIPHGQFGKWLKTNVPDLSRDTVCFYMTIGKGVMEKAKLPLSKFRNSEICRPGKLPEEVEPLIAGKTQHQLFIEYKQAKVQDDCYTPAAGRLKGSDGNPRHKRDAFEARNAEEQREVDEQLCHKMGAWLKAIANDARAGHPEFCQQALATLYAGVESFSSYLRSKKQSGRASLAERAATK